MRAERRAPDLDEAEARIRKLQQEAELDQAERPLRITTKLFDRRSTT